MIICGLQLPGEPNRSTDYKWLLNFILFICFQLHFDLGSFHFFREEYSVASEHITQAAELCEQLNDETTLYCTVSKEDLKGYSEACDVSTSTESSQNLTLQFHRAIRDQYTVSVSNILIFCKVSTEDSFKFSHLRIAREVTLYVINFKRKIWTWTGIRTQTFRSLVWHSAIELSWFLP